MTKKGQIFLVGGCHRDFLSYERNKKLLDKLVRSGEVDCFFGEGFQALLEVKRGGKEKEYERYKKHISEDVFERMWQGVVWEQELAHYVKNTYGIPITGLDGWINTEDMPFLPIFDENELAMFLKCYEIDVATCLETWSGYQHKLFTEGVLLTREQMQWRDFRDNIYATIVKSLMIHRQNHKAVVFVGQLHMDGLERNLMRDFEILRYDYLKI